MLFNSKYDFKFIFLHIEPFKKQKKYIDKTK